MSLRFSPARLKQMLFLNIGVMAAYFLFGLLGLELAVPPSNASAIWPAAGVALASTLLLGPDAALGIFIGNFIVSAWSFSFNEQSIIIYLTTAIGATTSALTGSYLIKHYIDFPGPLLEDRHIILFLVLGGPFSCLIPATFSILTMTANGVIAPAQIPATWFTWWVGDSIGVLVFTPLSLILFAPPIKIWRQKLIPVGIPLILSFIAVTIFFFHIRENERQQHDQLFKQQALLLSEALKHRIQDHIQNIDGISKLLLEMPTINARNFSFFSRQLRQEFVELERIEWQLYQTDQGYFKTVFSEPQNPSVVKMPVNALTGFATAQPTAPLHITIVNDKILLQAPMYQKTDKQQPQGRVLGIVSIATLIDQAFSTLEHEGIYLTLAETDSNTGYSIIYSTLPDHIDRSSVQQSPFNIADRQWRLYFYRDPTLDHSHNHWFMWSFLISGLLFTGLLGLGLLLLTGRYVRTALIVNERTKDLMQAKNIAETANKTKDQFLAKISHELRTPLNGIMGFTQLLQKNSNLSGLEKQHIAIISHCSEDLLTLINDILDITAIENNTIKLSPEKFNFSVFINEITELFRLKAQEKQLEFIITQRDLPHYLNGDPKRIRQILSNLLNNAIKYTDRGRISLDIQYCNKHLQFTVTDTGCGISSEHLKLIFSPFIQICTQGTVKEGIGIGLAICKELIKLMEGEITVHSELGKGSTFTVTLPLSSNDIEALTHNEDKNHRLVYGNRKINILIADDNEINLLLLTNLLDQQYCHIDSALNGKQALDLINRNTYDLAFIDLNMPVMNGLELVEQLRKQNNPLTMVAISAYADEHMIQKALNTGFDHYLTKPISSKQLNRLLQKHTSPI